MQQLKILTDYYKGPSEEVSWYGDTTCVDTTSGWNRNPEDFAVSCIGEAFSCHFPWPTLQKFVTCITSNAAADMGGDASLDTSPRAPNAGRLSI